MDGAIIAVAGLALTANVLLAGIYVRLGRLAGVIEGVKDRVTSLEDWARQIGGFVP